MTPELLRAIGEALYGPHWISPLAEALQINTRNLQRWAAGDVLPRAEAQAGLLRDMRRLLVAHGRRLERVVADVDRATAKL